MTSLSPADSTPSINQPIPIEISVRFETKATLYRMLDAADDRMRQCKRSGDVAGWGYWDNRHLVIWNELDRRDMIAAEREAKRQDKIRAAAAHFRKTGEVRA